MYKCIENAFAFFLLLQFFVITRDVKVKLNNKLCSVIKKQKTFIILCKRRILKNVKYSKNIIITVCIPISCQIVENLCSKHKTKISIISIIHNRYNPHLKVLYCRTSVENNNIFEIFMLLNLNRLMITLTTSRNNSTF